MMKLLVIIFLLFAVLVSGNKSGLFDSGGPVVILDSQNFSEIYQKPYSWFVLFYAHWCGHCHNYAPIWLKFSKEIKDWSHILRTAAIDCADKMNEALCEQHKIHAYPTVKLFPPQSSKENLTRNLHLGIDVPIMLAQTVDILQNVSADPHFNPIRSVADLSVELKKRHPGTEQYTGLVALVRESNSSFVGRALILDFEKVPDVEVFRIVGTPAGPQKTSAVNVAPLLYISRNNEHAPALVQIDKKSDDFLTLFRGQINSVRGQVTGDVSGSKSGASSAQPSPDGASKLEVTKMRIKPPEKRAHERDIDSAVYYSLTHDVGMKDEMTPGELQGLKQFIDVLIKYHWMPDHMTKFLVKSRDWLSRQTALSGQQWRHFLDSNRTSGAHLLSTRGEQWSACRGSAPKYRGYPCGLWIVFHSLAAEAHARSLVDPKQYDARQVLVAMVNYVTNFFSCQQCAFNFKTETESFKTKVKSSQDAVLYLWRVHNVVNKRLSGDASEDPESPKIEFPSTKQCHRCRISENPDTIRQFSSMWNEKEVLNFLLNFFIPKHIIKDRDAETFVEPLLESSQTKSKDGKYQDKIVVISKKVRDLYEKKLRNVERADKVQYMQEIEYKTRNRSDSSLADGMSSTDVGLCLIFYVFCVLLFLVVYCKITRKGAPCNTNASRKYAV